MRLAVQSSYGTACRAGCRPAGAYRWRARALATEAAADVPELVSWVERSGGRVQGATLANLAGRDGGSGWGLKALQVRAPSARAHPPR
jgi:histone-lysine N-methyltransferase SETD3